MLRIIGTAKMEIRKRKGLRFVRNRAESEANKAINVALARFKEPRPHSWGEQIMAEKMARSAGKAFKQGNRIKGKLGKALGLGSAALQIY